MNCNKIQSLLSAFADRELSGVEMFLVRQHVHDCDACRAEDAELRRVRSVLSSLEAAEPSPDFESRLVSAVMGCKPVPAEAKRLRWTSGIAAVSLTAAAAVCFVYGVRGVPHALADGAAQSKTRTVIAPPVAPNMGVSLERDSAFINASDPLAGPQVAVAASYARP